MSVESREDVQPPVSIEEIKSAANKVKELTEESLLLQGDPGPDTNRYPLSTAETFYSRFMHSVGGSERIIDASTFIMLKTFRKEVANSIVDSMILQNHSDAEILSVCTWELL